MSTRTMTVTVDGTEYEGRVGVVKSTYLGREDHGIFTFLVTVEGDWGGVGVGTYGLDAYCEQHERREGAAVGMEAVIRVLDTFGVESWEKIKGQTVIVLFRDGLARGLAHATNEGRFVVLQDLYRDFKREHPESVNA